jgi:glycosyltransferase involved in cell wall biosynthesis
VSDCIADTDVQALLGPELREACVSIIVVDRVGAVERRMRRVRKPQLRLIIEGLWPVPREVMTIGAALVALAQQLSGQHFELAHCFRLKSGRLPRLFKRYGVTVDRIVLDLDDYESRASFRSARPLVRVVGRQLAAARFLEGIKWAVLERLQIPRFDDVYVCSELDQARLRRRFPANRWRVVPNVVAEPRHPSVVPHDRFTFLFVGQLGYPPNTDAVLFFCERVLPLLRRLAPAPFRVLIVGRHPGSLVRLEALEEVEVIANPPDVAPYYAESDVAVVPLRAGSGTRIKILEAFSFGVPVISTTIGAEGLAVTPETDILIADDPQSFADQCQRVWVDATRRHDLAVAGRALWRRLYSPTTLEATLTAILAPEGERNACFANSGPLLGRGHTL